jgi:hypothetical protein
MIKKEPITSHNNIPEEIQPKYLIILSPGIISPHLEKMPIVVPKMTAKTDFTSVFFIS